MERILESIHASYAYERGFYGRGIGVAVLDTGIFPHQDLQNKTIYFKDYIKGRRMPYDDNGHGTHISGIIGAKNDTGRHGVAPECSLLGFKVLDRGGNGLIEDTCRAVEHVIRMNRETPGAVRIINVSVGMTGAARPGQQSRLLEVVEKAWDSGIVVVAAAGFEPPTCRV